MNLLENVRRLCKNEGISLEKLGTKLGFCSKLLYHWNTSDPKLSNVIAVADYFGVSLDELCDRGGNRSALSDEERELVGLFKQLNEQGKVALMTTAKAFATQPIYKKCDLVKEVANDNAKEG